MTKVKILGTAIILSVAVVLPALAEDARSTHLRRAHNEARELLVTSPRVQRIDNSGPALRDPARIGGADADLHPASS
jgi:hypothetical protein